MAGPRSNYSRLPQSVRSRILYLRHDGADYEEIRKDPEIAADFADYYELYRKYESDYRVTDILCGVQDKAITERARQAGFDERYALLGLLLEAAGSECAQLLAQDSDIMLIKKTLSEIKTECEKGGDAQQLLRRSIQQHGFCFRLVECLADDRESRKPFGDVLRRQAHRVDGDIAIWRDFGEILAHRLGFEHSDLAHLVLLSVEVGYFDAVEVHQVKSSDARAGESDCDV